MGRLNKMPISICPVCSDLFTESDLYHCLVCDSHYPPDHGFPPDYIARCHHCQADLSKEGYRLIETSLCRDDILRICEWDRAQGRKRGTWKIYEGGQII